VAEALTTSGVADLRIPTLGEGETIADLIADRSSFEEFDVDAASARGFGFVKLNQLALEHLTGFAA
jgi:xylose isomerase